MNYEINKKASKSGKQVVYFITVQGLRINGINYRVKAEAVRFFKDFVAQVGEEKILAWVAANKK
ncbi:MAG TPA: hypothetical protein VGE24_17680 [Emticicia sp.]